MGSPSRDGRIRRTRNSTDDCGGRRGPSASAAPVTGREPLTKLTLIVFVRPLLGNKGVHIINGKVVNTKTDGFTLIKRKRHTNS